MSWIKKQYPVGRKLESYPSPAGDFPATVDGYVTYHDLNSRERKQGVRVKVHVKNDEGQSYTSFEDFDPTLLDL